MVDGQWPFAMVEFRQLFEGLRNKSMVDGP
jgi:hypothetical protein